MSLTTGSRLGHYEVLSLLGAGGMGQVYRARDTKLGREVAIKILTEAFAEHEERLARFEREARVLALLNHPNIANIHGLEESNGLQFLVMELVEGETLAERLRRGTVPVDEALRIFQHMAEGLEAAHEKGIVHRDLKPANVKITPEGEPKILDFGLAKVLAGEAVVQDRSQSPTVTRDATETGVLVGTAPYMSPEQARGKPVDKRTDIWAFGCCLYEALSGKAAFLGETVSDTIGRIMEREPDWEALPEATPVVARSLLRRCLRKDAGHRVHDIGDARIEIEELRQGVVEPEPPPLLDISRRRAWVTAVLGAATAALVVFALTHWVSRSTPMPTVRFVVSTPETQILQPHFPDVLALADGSGIVYNASTESGRRLFFRSWDGLPIEPIPGTEGARGPFQSPDGKSLGFVAEGELKILPRSARISVSVAEATNFRGASWSETGTIVYTPSSNGGLWQVRVAGGTPAPPAPLTEPDLDAGELNHRWPSFIPGSRNLIFTVWTATKPGVAAMSLETGVQKRLFEDASGGRYAAGYLLFQRSSTLMAAPFDEARLELLGPERPVVDGVSFSSNTGAVHFDVSGDGSLVYVPGGNDTGTQALVFLNRSGRIEERVQLDGAFELPRVSPDGESVALQRGDPVAQVWLFDQLRAVAHRAIEPYSNYPVWTPDGARLIFRSLTRDGNALSWARVGVSEPATELFQSVDPVYPRSVLPDGSALAFDVVRDDTGVDIWVLSLGDEAEAEPLMATQHDEGGVSFAPDGRWLAFTSNAPGRNEVFIQAYPGPGPRVQVSRDGGGQPVWSRDGSKVFFTNGDGILAASVSAVGNALNVSRPQLLFEMARSRFDLPVPGVALDYDVGPDARFVALLRPATPARRDIHVVLNWFQELKRLVPTN